MGNTQSVPERRINKDAMNATLSGMKAATNAIDSKHPSNKFNFLFGHPKNLGPKDT
jgi:hypothetical protein